MMGHARRLSVYPALPVSLEIAYLASDQRPVELSLSVSDRLLNRMSQSCFPALFAIACRPSTRPFVSLGNRD